MEKYKRLKTTIITLLVAVAALLLSAVFLISSRGTAAYATDRFVNLDGNTVFYTSIQGAEITHSEKITEGEGDQAKDHYYTLFKISGDQTVSYRQSLAYNWINGVRDEENKPTGEMDKENKFSMKISFTKLNFKRYIVRFQSQQYELTKDGKSENYLIFAPTENGEMIDIYVSQTIEEENGNIKGATKASVVCDKNATIEVSFGFYANGEYPIFINGKDAGISFKNVSERYAKYVSSGDKAVTPLTFSAQFADGADAPAEMILYSINGQSFEMHEQTNGQFRVKDTASPVICFGKTPSYLEYGKSIGFNYTVIDVLASNPGAKVFYYVLSDTQYSDKDFDYDRTDYSEKEGAKEGEATEEKQKSPFTEITSTSETRIVRDAHTFIPSDLIESNVYGLVKLYFELYDVSYSSSSSIKDIVFADWYAKEDALVNINALKGDTTAEPANFLKLIDSKPGVTYSIKSDEDYGAATDALEQYKADIAEFERRYGEKITAAIKEQNPDGEEKLYAGGEKFYLPAIEWDFADEFMTGKDYKYSVYYRAKTTGSNTSLDANALSMELKEADETYRFTVFVTDGFTSTMRYPTDEFEDGKRVWKEIDTDDIWDEDYSELLPFFEVDVSYKEATCENPDDLSLAYVGTNYSGVSFDVKGVSGTYVSTYKLYVFDRNAYDREVEKSLEYTEFVEKLEELLQDPATRKYFTTVKASGELLEMDENYDKFRALNWNASGVSFTPQSVEDFYVVELTLTDKRSKISTNNYATVAASVQTTPLKGESEWLENNLTSVILFSIAGVCLVALIVLLIVKPKDKGDIDAVYSEVSEKKTKKKNGKK